MAHGDHFMPKISLLSDYDYVRFLTKSRVAWEYLRRHLDYRSDWQTSRSGRCRPIKLSDGTYLLRARRRFKSAEAWGLYIFRQPQCDSA